LDSIDRIRIRTSSSKATLKRIISASAVLAIVCTLHLALDAAAADAWSPVK
jgi:hypothetical protein